MALRESNSTKYGAIKPSVAVCISGQPSRLWPRSLIENLVDANPLYAFDVLLALGPIRVLVYNTVGLPARDNALRNMTHYRSPLADLAAEDLRLVMQAFGSGRHAVHVLDVTRDRDADEWRREMRTSKLGGIYMYTSTQDGILNTYAHHASCARAIETLEDVRGRRFDYIISTRDDIYLIGPLKLLPLLATDSTCDIYTKGCMGWGGLNDRFHILRRERGLALLASRLDFYRIVIHEPPTDRVHRTKNPERFEYQMTGWLGMRVCTCPWDARSASVWNTTARESRCTIEIPVVAARFSSNGTACFMPKELSSPFTAECYAKGDPLHKRECGARVHKGVSATGS